MDRTNRKELLEMAEKQKEELDRYKGRLRDLAVAYRSLVKEKEALEASVKALTAPNQTRDTNASAEAQDGDTQDEGDGVGEGDGGNIAQLRQQITTLTLSLSTVSEQKSKMETNFQDDKKKMRQEQMDALQRVNEEKDNLQSVGEQLTQQLAETKAKLRVHQQERESDNLNNAAMMRELQNLVSRERTEKEKLENKIFDLEETVMRLKSAPDKSVEYEGHIERLSKELGVVRNQLYAAEEAARRPPPLLLQLQKDMAEMKAQHRMQIELEQQKARETEERLQKTRAAEEQRVADLESKLSDLSDTVGTYDRGRQQDQHAIQRLKERISQLDLENTALARAANKSTVMAINEEEDLDSEASVAEIKERIMKLKGLFKLACHKAEKPVDIDDVLNIDDYSSREGDPNHSACQQELKRLKEEFESYKTRASNVLKNRTTRDTTHNKELEQLQGQLADMRERVSILRQQLDDEEAAHKQSIEDFQQRVAKMKDKHKVTLAQAENDYKLKAADLDQQVQKQRERTIALLADKDQVVNDLKIQLNPSQSYQHAPPHNSSDHYSPADDVQSVASEDYVSSETEETVSQLVHAPHSPGQTGSSFLHFAEEQARKEVELAGVKRQKQQVETALRQLQDKHANSVQNYQEEMENLRDEVDRWQRNRSREGTNLEYLKNVVLSYYQTDSYSTKKQMFNAIAAILQFTKKEKDAVTKKLGAAWWGTG
ncbi:GRIP and coiled-coil domain-containing protein 1 isoform X2 [Strongylocentrotus purpuratus]|uniref:GRIP domain-containing protein n=1 Tax=Strongylocentrotus purpuratus TaxID=7668 RepID=A0A7M7T0I2_STRPU|nr:GRIP and coiled-coil domain-containing protein 1 isoform X2 [Strongylocentrotus purpuratus]